MKSKTIIASLLLLAAGSLASLACDCNDAKKVEEEPTKETATQFACADNTDKSTEAPTEEEATEEN